MSSQVDTVSFKLKRHRPQSLNLSSMSIRKLADNALDSDDNAPAVSSSKSSQSSDTAHSAKKILEGSNTNIKSVQLQYHEDHSNVALRLVSPGLPKLSDEMKNTMKLSQQIHLQQQHIIKARNSGNDEEEFLDITRFQDEDKGEKKVEVEETDKVDVDPEVQTERQTDVEAEAQTEDQSPEHNAHGVDQSNTSEDDANTESPESGRPPESAKPIDVSLEDSKLSSTSSTTSRGLKRKHVPSPLNIDESTPAPNPLIHSAPLFNRIKFNNPTHKKFQTTPVSKSFNAYLTPHKSSPYHPNKKVRMMPQNYNYSPFSQATSSTSPYFARSKAFYQQYTPQPTATHNRMYPPIYPHNYAYTGTPIITDKPQTKDNALQQPPKPAQAGTPQAGAPQLLGKPAFNPRLEAQLYSLGIPTESRKVVDVFRGDLIKDAPLQSQPLSSQKEFFDHTPSNIKQLIEEDRSPVSEDEIKEMQEKYQKNNEVFTGPAGAYPHFPMISAQGQGIQGPTSSHLARFPMPMPPNIVAPGKPNEIVGSIQFMNEKFFNFKIFDDDSEDSKREKFLKLCEKTWDEFSKRDKQ